MDDEAIEQLRAERARAYDDARPEAVAKVHDRGRLTARERIDAVIDPGSFVETGVLAGAEDEAAGGLVAGLGTLYGRTIAISSYDYTVWGGTQTGINHSKIDRIMDLAIRHRFPFVCFADGGGARAQGLRSAGFFGGGDGQRGRHVRRHGADVGVGADGRRRVRALVRRQRQHRRDVRRRVRHPRQRHRHRRPAARRGRPRHRA